MTDTFRALLFHIAEQLTHATDPDDLGIRADQLVEQIGAALAQPPAAGPTDEQVADLAEQYNGDPVPAIRRALELWGRPAAVPVPVSERPWERAGWCNEEGSCWMGNFGGNGSVQSWRLCKPSKSTLPWSLPWWALPLPQPRPTEQQP